MIYEDLFVFTVVGFYIWSLRSIFYWVKLWQNVKYQPRVFIRSSQARSRINQYLFSFSSLLSWIGIIVALYLTIDDQPAIYYQLIIFSIFLLKAGIVIRDVITSRMLYPSFSVRSLLIMVFSTLSLSVLFMFPLTENYIWLLILDRLLFFIVNGFVFFLSFPSEIADDLQVKRAIKKLHKQKNLTFILLTGSQEAGNVSYFLTQVLKKHQHVLTIHDEYLTQSQVAARILHDLTPQIDVVIVSTEKAQDISWVHFFFTPHMTVIFDPVDVHIDKKAYLIQVLSLVTKKQKIFLDVSLQKYLHGKRSKQQISLFSNDSERMVPGESVIRLSEVKQKKLSFALRAVLHSTVIDLRTPLIGTNLQLSLLLTAAIVHAFGFTQKQIKEDFMVLLPLPQNLVYHHSVQGVIFVDNTGNTSVKGIQSLLFYSKLFTKSRMYIIGKESILTKEKIMKELCSDIAKSTTHVLLLPSAVRPRLKKMIKQTNSDCTVREMSTTQVISYIKEHAKRGDVVMFEGEDCDEISRQLYRSYASSA